MWAAGFRHAVRAQRAAQATATLLTVCGKCRQLAHKPQPAHLASKRRSSASAESTAASRRQPPAQNATASAATPMAASRDQRGPPLPGCVCCLRPAGRCVRRTRAIFFAADNLASWCFTSRSAGTRCTQTLLADEAAGGSASLHGTDAAAGLSRASIRWQYAPQTPWAHDPPLYQSGWPRNHEAACHKVGRCVFVTGHNLCCTNPGCIHNPAALSAHSLCLPGRRSMP